MFKTKNNIEIKFAKCNQEARIPTKRKEDACFDLWSCNEDVVLLPHEIKLVDIGIATAFSSDWVAIIKERSSVGSKGITVHCGVIDSGYRNSWKVCLQNNTNIEIVLPKEKAIAQFMMLPVPSYKVQEITYEELLAIESERGLGGFGSTNV